MSDKMISGELLKAWARDKREIHPDGPWDAGFNRALESIIAEIHSGRLSPPAPCEVVEALEKLIRFVSINAMDQIVEDEDGHMIGWRKSWEFNRLIDESRKALSRQPSGSGWLPAQVVTELRELYKRLEENERARLTNSNYLLGAELKIEQFNLLCTIAGYAKALLDSLPQPPQEVSNG
jgi:hypothetical protein